MDSCPPTAADWANSTAQSAKQQGELLQKKTESLEKRVEWLEGVIKKMGVALGIPTEPEETLFERRRRMAAEEHFKRMERRP